MKLIKLTDDHYVVVDDSEIKEGDWCIHNGEMKQAIGDVVEFAKKHSVKITHSTKPIEYIKNGMTALSLQEVKELIGETDKVVYHNMTLEQMSHSGHYDFVQGYNQALEDNKEKKYTEAQLIWAIQEAYGHGQDDEFDGVNKVEESIKAITKHLQPKTEWEYIGECKGNNGNGCFMDSPGHDCGCYKRVPKTSWEIEIVDGKLKLV